MNVFSVNGEDILNKMRMKLKVAGPWNPNPALHPEIKLFRSSETKREDVFTSVPRGTVMHFWLEQGGLWRDRGHRCFGMHDSECWKPLGMHFISQCRRLYLLSLLPFWCLLNNVLVFLVKTSITGSICQKVLLKTNIIEMPASSGTSFVSLSKALMSGIQRRVQRWRWIYIHIHIYFPIYDHDNLFNNLYKHKLISTKNHLFRIW